MLFTDPIWDSSSNRAVTCCQALWPNLAMVRPDTVHPAALSLLQVLTWLVLPFFQVYADAGDFTVGGRCMTSLKENGLLYGLAGAAGGQAGHILQCSHYHCVLFTLHEDCIGLTQLSISHTTVRLLPSATQPCLHLPWLPGLPPGPHK